MGGFELCISNLDLALVFAEIAEHSSSPLTRSRNLGNARDAFLRLRNEPYLYSPKDWRRAAIVVKLRELRSRLWRLGQKFA